MWKKFPETAPYDGTRILVGGWVPPISEQDSYKGNLTPTVWVEVVASWTSFNHTPIVACQQVEDVIYKWVISGFTTLDNWNVEWEYWSAIPEPPNKYFAKLP